MRQIYLPISIIGGASTKLDLVVEISIADDNGFGDVLRIGSCVAKLFIFCGVDVLDKVNVIGFEATITRGGNAADTDRVIPLRT